MKNAILMMSGWMAAAAFAVLAFMRLPAESGSRTEAAHVAGPGAAASVPVEESPSAEPSPEGAEDSAPAAEAFAETGDDWEPPGKIDGPEGLHALLCNASRADRETADRILAARKSGDNAALLSAAGDALRSAEPKVRAMAVAALVEMAAGQEGLSWIRSEEDWFKGRTKAAFTPEEERTRSGLLLAFSGDGNDYVRNAARRGFINALASTCDFDVARDLSAEAFGLFRAGDDLDESALAEAMSAALGVDSGEVDPERFEKGMQALGEFVHGEDWDYLEGSLFHLYSLMSRGEENPLKDAEQRESLVAQWKAKLMDAQELFPQDNEARKAYVNVSDLILASAMSRFEDLQSERAKTWVAEMQTLLAKRLAERDKSKSVAGQIRLPYMP